jgi:hypothetical protein
MISGAVHPELEAGRQNSIPKPSPGSQMSFAQSRPMHPTIATGPNLGQRLKIRSKTGLVNAKFCQPSHHQQILSSFLRNGTT